VANLLKAHNINETQIRYLLPVSYAACLQSKGYLAATPNKNDDYNFSKEDFTLEAWIKPVGEGAIISRKSRDGGRTNCGGFLIVLRSDSTIKLATDDGLGFYEIDSVKTTAFNGKWHHIAGVRKNGVLQLYFDGSPLDGEISKNKETPLNVDNGMRLLIGATDQCLGDIIPYSGLIGEVRIWNISKNQVDIATYMTSKLKGNESGLVGYWNFDKEDGQDLSNMHNNMVAQNIVTFVEAGADVQ